jgi:signal transduction histidine kinase
MSIKITDQTVAVLKMVQVSALDISRPEMLDEIARQTAEITGIDGCTFLELNRETNRLEIICDYISKDVESPFTGIDQTGAAYPLKEYPATAEVLRSQKPLLVSLNDPHADPNEIKLLETFQWETVLLAPMLYREQSIGLAKFSRQTKNSEKFTAQNSSLYQSLANLAGLIIKTTRLYEEGGEGQLHAEALQVIGRALASELDYQRIVRNVADFAYRLTGADFVFVTVPKNDRLNPVAAVGHQPGEGRAIQIDEILPGYLNHPILLKAVSEERPVTGNGNNLAGATAHSIVAVPLMAHNKLVGTLAAIAHPVNFFSATDVATLMSLASQAAVAIQNANLFAELEAQRETLRQVSLRLVNAQEEERRRISRELHDELGQALTALKINLDLARRALPDDAPPKLHQSIHEASALALQTLDTARNMSLSLHPAMLDDLGLVAALRWDIDRYEQRTGQTVFLEAVLDDIELEPELQITVYRIITESLTNAARHAQASDIRVNLFSENNQVYLTVKDNGIGFDAQKWRNAPEQRQSLGLISMQERAELLEGSLTIVSSPGQGTTINGKFPLTQ